MFVRTKCKIPSFFKFKVKAISRGALRYIMPLNRMWAEYKYHPQLWLWGIPLFSLLPYPWALPATKLNRAWAQHGSWPITLMCKVGPNSPALRFFFFFFFLANSTLLFFHLGSSSHIFGYIPWPDFFTHKISIIHGPTANPSITFN
jgi:hypothetical protein